MVFSETSSLDILLNWYSVIPLPCIIFVIRHFSIISVCNRRLGMESGQIQNEQIKLNGNCVSRDHYRLFSSPVFEARIAENWFSNYLSVNLQEDHVITAIATQGGVVYLDNSPLYLYAKHYKLQYITKKDHDDDGWKSYNNLDGSTKVQLCFNLSTDCVH